MNWNVIWKSFVQFLCCRNTVTSTWSLRSVVVEQVDRPPLMGFDQFCCRRRGKANIFGFLQSRRSADQHCSPLWNAKEVNDVKNMYAYSLPLTGSVSETTGCFFARFQKTQGSLQKNSNQFLAKNSTLWRQLWISRKKLKKFWQKYPEFIQVPGIFNKFCRFFVEFYKY